jgi:ribosomal protein S18 acetylase RimI-like enzyme
VPPRVISIPPAGVPQVREATGRDLDATAALHHEALTGLFVDLGPAFLRTFHRAFLGSPDGVVLVAAQHGRVIGFLVGSVDADAHARHVVRRQGLRLVSAGVRALVRRPALAGVVLRTRTGRYVRAIARRIPGLPRRTPTVAHAADGGTPRRAVAVLAHVATADAARGSGAGRLLVEAFAARCSAAGAGEIRLVTDPATPAPAFYRHLGWTSLGTRRGRDGTTVEEFRLPL